MPPSPYLPLPSDPRLLPICYRFISCFYVSDCLLPCLVAVDASGGSLLSSYSSPLNCIIVFTVLTLAHRRRFYPEPVIPVHSIRHPSKLPICLSVNRPSRRCIMIDSLHLFRSVSPLVPSPSLIVSFILFFWNY